MLFLSGAVVDAQTATYRRADGFLPPVTDTAQLRALALEQFPVLEQSGSDLRLQHQIKSPGGTHYTYIQTWQGLPVHGAGLKATLDHSGRIRSWMEYLVAFPHVSAPAFSYDPATIAPRMAEQTGAYEVQSAAQWLVQEGALLPVYQVITHQHYPVASYEILLDGRDGREISRTDRGAYFAEDTTGKALVFRPDPCTRAQSPYGTLFKDSSDLHKPFFTTLTDTIALKNITFRNDSFLLEGPFVKIQDISPFFTPPASSENGLFYFTREMPGFEDVMTYYHIDTFQRYVQRLGFTNLRNGPLRCDPHGQGNSDQSVFISNGGNSYLLFGEGGVDDAEDADVIIHEYGHALSDAAAPGTRTGVERRGLDEGVGDYFAAAYSYDLSHWQWEYLFNWDGQNEFWPGRMAITTTTYPPVSTSIYTYGMLWASTLMLIRQEIGAEVCDRLALQELYSNAPNMSLADGARLLLEADTLLYNGIHSPVINRYFCERGILPLNCAVGLPDAPELSWKLYPNPSEGELWILSPPGAAARLEMFDLPGRRLLLRDLAPGESTRISCPFADGWYVARLSAGGQSKSYRVEIRRK
jgi:zinc metalloprotease ZmpB